MNDQEIIQFHGGPTKLARRLGLSGPQVVQNWIKRGIPSKVKVDHPDIFLRHLQAIASQKPGNQQHLIPRRRSTDPKP